MEVSISGNHRQVFNKKMKDQGENKNRSNEFHEFIHYLDNLIRPLYICQFSLRNKYISDPKREYK